MDAKIGSNNYASFLDQNSIGFYFYPGEQRMILFPAYRAFTKIHSPNTTDEIKYKFQFACGSANGMRVSVGGSGRASTLTLMEIGA